MKNEKSVSVITQTKSIIYFDCLKILYIFHHTRGWQFYYVTIYVERVDYFEVIALVPSFFSGLSLNF